MFSAFSRALKWCVQLFQAYLQRGTQTSLEAESHSDSSVPSEWGTQSQTCSRLQWGWGMEWERQRSHRGQLLYSSGSQPLKKKRGTGGINKNGTFTFNEQTSVDDILTTVECHIDSIGLSFMELAWLFRTRVDVHNHNRTNSRGWRE